MEKEDGSYDGGKGWSDACGDDIGGEEWNGSGAKRTVPDKWNRSYSRCFWSPSVLDRDWDVPDSSQSDRFLSDRRGSGNSIFVRLHFDDRSDGVGGSGACDVFVSGRSGYHRKAL